MLFRSILKKLEKSRKKKKKEGRQLGRNTRNLNLTGKGSNTLDFYIEKFSTLGTQLKLSLICSAKEYVKGIALSGVIEMNATRQR